MKKSLCILLFIITFSLVLNSCKKTPECETNHKGTLTVNNNTNNLISVVIYQLSPTYITYGSVSCNPNSVNKVDLPGGYTYRTKYYLSGVYPQSDFIVEECGEYTLNIP